MEEPEHTKENHPVVFTFPDGTKYEGTVELEGVNAYELDVDDLPEQAWPPIERLEARAKKGSDKYVFLDVHCRGRSWHKRRDGDSSTTHFLPTTTFYANDPDNPLSSDVTSMDVKVDNLDLWFNKSLFKLEDKIKQSGNALKFSLQEEIGRYSFKEFELTFELAIGGLEFWRDMREVNLDQGAHIELHVPEGAKDVPYQEFVNALRSIERLLGLAFRSPIRAVEFSVTSKKFGLNFGDNPEPMAFPAYTITSSNTLSAAPLVRLGDEPAFTLDQVGDFQKLLDRWSDLEEELTPTIDLFYSSVSGGSTVLENIFLNRIQGIEGFHRRLRPGTIQTPEKYEEQKARILSKFTGADKGLLKKVLSRGNDISLPDRLRSLDSELKLKGMPTIMTCDMDVVGHTRDYYSHYEKDIADVCPDDKMMELTHQAGQMLYALILTELAIPDDVVSKAIRRNGLINPF